MRIETPRLVLDPVGSEHAADLFLVHSDPEVAYWSDAWSPEQAAAAAAGWLGNGKPIRSGSESPTDASTAPSSGRGGLSLAMSTGSGS
jgi:hypothetical protein